MAEKPKPDNFRPLRSITRLLIGGILLGSNALDDQLREWEGYDAADTEGDVHEPPEVESLPDTLPAPQVGIPPRRNVSDVRYALIGLIFEGEEKLEEVMDGAKRIGERSDRVLNPLFRPIRKVVSSRPVREGIDQLASRGQTAVDRWVSRGREEETLSRQLTQQAATSTVDQSIHYMAENEAITELIQVQGVSLAEQILELIRALSVSADYFGEGLVRYILRSKPRYLLPPPSHEVQEQASWMVQDLRNEDL